MAGDGWDNQATFVNKIRNGFSKIAQNGMGPRVFKTYHFLKTVPSNKKIAPKKMQMTVAALAIPFVSTDEYRMAQQFCAADHQVGRRKKVSAFGEPFEGSGASDRVWLGSRAPGRRTPLSAGGSGAGETGWGGWGGGV